MTVKHFFPAFRQTIDSDSTITSGDFKTAQTKDFDTWLDNLGPSQVSQFMSICKSDLELELRNLDDFYLEKKRPLLAQLKSPN
jgi:hypothetical protein